MTMQFGRDQFDNIARLPMLVVVDPRTKHLAGESGVSRAACAGIVARCRSALRHARAHGLAVAYLRGDAAERACDGGSNAWIRGFEPMRSEILLERRGLSCYDSGFFDEVAQAAGGDVVLAGFLGEGGCLATAADSMYAGHRITILSDATYDEAARNFSDGHLKLLRAFTKLDINAMTTGNWIKSFENSLLWSRQCG